MVENSLKKIMAETFNIDKDDIHDDSSMKNIAQWKSLRHMEFITSLEQALEIQLTMDEIVEMTDMQTIKHILRSKNLSI